MSLQDQINSISQKIGEITQVQTRLNNITSYQNRDGSSYINSIPKESPNYREYLSFQNQLSNLLQDVSLEELQGNLQSLLSQKAQQDMSSQVMPENTSHVDLIPINQTANAPNVLTLGLPLVIIGLGALYLLSR